jgi:hypothetical protein
LLHPLGILQDLLKVLYVDQQYSTALKVRSYLNMSASQNQSAFNGPPPGTTFGANDTVPQKFGTPAMSVGSATAAGHGPHPKDNADDSNATLSSSKYGPQREDLEGEQIRPPGEGDVMGAQLDKKNAGWGEEKSLTSDLDRQKAEQQGAREEMKAARKSGLNVGGTPAKTDDEGLGAV